MKTRMDQYEHIKTKLNEAEQSLYVAQITGSVSDLQQSHIHLSLVEQELHALKTVEGPTKRVKLFGEQLRHLRETQEAVQQNS